MKHASLWQPRKLDQEVSSNHTHADENAARGGCDFFFCFSCLPAQPAMREKSCYETWCIPGHDSSVIYVGCLKAHTC